MADNTGSSSVARGFATGSGNPPRRPSYASVLGGSVTPRTATTSRVTSTPSAVNFSTPHRDGLASMDLITTSHMLPSDPITYGSTSDKLANNVNQPVLWIPSYLKRSRFARQLEQMHKHRLKQSMEASSASQESRGDRIVPSTHRGMTYDVEESIPFEETSLTLPTSLSQTDKHVGIEIVPGRSGHEFKYTGNASKADLEAASIRSDQPISPRCGLYYYEIRIKQKHNDCAVAIGFAEKAASLERLPGWEPRSWAFHGDDGKVFYGGQSRQSYAKPFGAADTVIGCGIDFNKNQAFFTRQGVDLKVAFRDFLPTETPLYPCIGVKKYAPVNIEVNFGQEAFQYDIKGRMRRAEAEVQAQIAVTSTDALHEGQTATAFTQELIAQYLSHAGFVESARAFTEQVQQDQQLLDSEASFLPDLQNPELPDARPRQQIRSAIQRGDIDAALAQITEQFPAVLTQQPYLRFRLKCCKLLEMMKESIKNHEKRQSATATKSSSNGHATSDPEDEAMDVDADDSLAPSESNTSATHSVSGVSGNSKSPAPSDASDPEQAALDSTTLDYGRLLNEEYRNSAREYTDALAQINSLMAYWTPSSSPHGDLLDPATRVQLAEDANGAILESLGRNSTATLETAVLQTEALIDVLARDGGPASLVCLHDVKTESR